MKAKGEDHTGSEEDAVGFAENKHSEQLYSHNCSKNCQDKGLFEITGLIHCSFIKHCNMLPALGKLFSIPLLTFQFCFVQLTHTVTKFLQLPNARAWHTYSKCNIAHYFVFFFGGLWSAVCCWWQLETSLRPLYVEGSCYSSGIWRSKISKYLSVIAKTCSCILWQTWQ